MRFRKAIPRSNRPSLLAETLFPPESQPRRVVAAYLPHPGATSRRSHTASRVGRPPQRREIRRVVERQRNVARHLGHESHFAWRVSIEPLATESDCPQFAARRG